MTRVLLTCVTLGVLAALLPAQTGTYAKFGKGCPGSGGTLTCASQNAQGGTVMPLFNPLIIQFAIEVQTRSKLTILGFELYTRAARPNTTVMVQTHVFREDTVLKTPQLAPVRSGTMTISRDAWYRTEFAAPLTVNANERIFLAVSETPLSRIMWPYLTQGQMSPHYERRNNQGPWKGPLRRAWAYRIICPTSGRVPELSNAGAPTIFKSFSITLAEARRQAPAVLVTGASNKKWGAVTLPLDLTGAGAPGCWLLASIDVLGGTGTGASGKAAIAFQLPNQATLVGLVFHNQWMVVDPTNALRLVFSNGGTGRVGR